MRRLLFIIPLAIFTGCTRNLPKVFGTRHRPTALDSFFANYIIRNRVQKIILTEHGNLFFKAGTVHGYLKDSHHPTEPDIEFDPGALIDFSSYVVEHEDDIHDSVLLAPVYLNGFYLFSVPDKGKKRVA